MARLAFTLLTIAVALPAFVLSPQSPLGERMWPEPKHDAVPTGAQAPLFMVLGVLEAVVFGLAVAFLLFGWKYTRAVLGGGRFGLAVHVSIAWIFGNFWLHDSLHYVNGIDLAGLLAIDYLFHVPLKAAGLVVAYAMVRLAREQGTGTGPGQARAAARAPAKPQER